MVDFEFKRSWYTMRVPNAESRTPKALWLSDALNPKTETETDTNTRYMSTPQQYSEMHENGQTFDSAWFYWEPNLRRWFIEVYRALWPGVNTLAIAIPPEALPDYDPEAAATATAAAACYFAAASGAAASGVVDRVFPELRGWPGDVSTKRPDAVPDDIREVSLDVWFFVTDDDRFVVKVLGHTVQLDRFNGLRRALGAKYELDDPRASTV